MRIIQKLPLIIIMLIFSWGGAPLMAIEEPQYTVLETHDRFEIRQYAAYLVAETAVTAPFEETTNIGFRILFDYISGNNVKQEKIKMTTPVNQRQAEPTGAKLKMTAPVSQKMDPDRPDKYLVSFVVPAKYTLESVPQPRDPRVKIRQIPARVVAVRRYSGSWREANYRKHETILREALAEKGIPILGEPVLARYNPPFWPRFLRRNEVLLEIKYTP